MTSSSATTSPGGREHEQHEHVEAHDTAGPRWSKEHLDRKLDEALDETFPASDPIELSANRD